MLHLLWLIIVGVVVGSIAKFLMPGKDPKGFWITAALGIGGSLLASYLGQMVGLYQEGQSAGIIMSVLGAIVLLVIYHIFTRKSG
jgi:uncharacterized membrane protein YeaQ/YmgE (transglycosylase-associated protein family)